MKITNPAHVYVLKTSDEAMIVDEDGDVHNAFQQDRRLVVLSVPKSLDLKTATERFQLVDAVAQAME